MASIHEKQLWFVNIIRRNRNMTFREICNRWMDNTELNPYGKEIRVRTFHRYRREIQDLYGISIMCHKPTNSYYIDDESYGEKDNIKSWILDTVAIDTMLRENKSIHDRILLETIPSGQSFLPVISSAMKDNRKIEFKYRTFGSEEAYTTTLEPYFVKVFSQRWYMIGITERHPGEIRTFALDRVLEMRQTETPFTYPKDFSPYEYYMYRYGIFHDNSKPQTIRLKVSSTQSNYLRTLPLHESQKEDTRTEEYSIFSYRLCIDEDLIREIMSKCPHYEVLEPEGLRSEIKSRLKETLKKY